jgi:uncharacterized protein (DUF433 family)
MALTVEPQPIPLTITPEGMVRITGTRVPLETVVRAFYAGATPEEIAQDFPSVTLAQVYAVLAYYLAHRAEVDAYVAERTSLSAAVRAGYEARFNPVGVRARLLARQSAVEDVA